MVAGGGKVRCARGNLAWCDSGGGEGRTGEVAGGDSIGNDGRLHEIGKEEIVKDRVAMVRREWRNSGMAGMGGDGGLLGRRNWELWGGEGGIGSNSARTVVCTDGGGVELRGNGEFGEEDDPRWRGRWRRWRRRRQRRRWRVDDSEVSVAGARSGDGRRGSGGGGDGGWTPSPAFLEQPLEREITLFFLQMTAKVCEGSLPLL